MNSRWGPVSFWGKNPRRYIYVSLPAVPPWGVAYTPAHTRRHPPGCAHGHTRTREVTEFVSQTRGNPLFSWGSRMVCYHATRTRVRSRAHTGAPAGAGARPASVCLPAFCPRGATRGHLTRTHTHTHERTHTHPHAHASARASASAGRRIGPRIAPERTYGRTSRAWGPLCASLGVLRGVIWQG